MRRALLPVQSRSDAEYGCEHGQECPCHITFGSWRESVKREHLRESATHTTCPWKGEASSYDVVVEGMINKDAAWFYPAPKEAASEIKDRVAFWKGVDVH